VRRGDVTRRFDANFNHPKYALLLSTIETCRYGSAKLSSIIKDISGGATPRISEQEQYADTGIKFLRIMNVYDGEVVLDDVKYITPETNDGLLARSRLSQNDVVMTITGRVGSAAVIQNDVLPANINQHLVRIKVDEKVCTPEFLSAWLNCPTGLILSNQPVSGGTRIALDYGSIAKIRIPLPPLDIQRTLVAEMEAARESRRAKLNQADELLKSLDGWLLAQLGLETPPTDDRKVFAVRLGNIRKRFDVHANHPRFVKLFQSLNSHKFSLIPLKSLALDIFSGTTPLSGGNAYTNAARGIPFVRSGEITKDGLVAASQEVFLKPEVHDGLMKRSQLKQDDLLIAIVGATIGAAGVYNHSHQANINQAIAAVRLNTQKVLPAYVRWYLSTSVGQAILDFLKRPVARANINLEEIGDIPVLIPPLEIQQSIVEQVDNKRAEARRLRAEVEAEWQAAKERFEQQLLTGK
jgi:type I restriction enzyme S subunit